MDVWIDTNMDERLQGVQKPDSQPENEGAANDGFTATQNAKLNQAVEGVNKNKSPTKKKKNNRKKHDVSSAMHSKSAPVSRQQTIVDEADVVEKNNPAQKNVTKPIFTKLETKKKRKRKVKGVFGSVTSASTAREKTSQTSSDVDRGWKSEKKKKKHRKGKRHRKSKKKKSEDKSILQYLKRDAKTESDTEDEENDDEDGELTAIPMRRKMYRPHLGIPGQSFLRAELEDPITLVEEEFLPEGLQTLRLTRSQLAMNFLHNKPRTLKSIENQSEKSTKLDESRSKSAQESIISLDLIVSRVPSSSLTPNLLKIAPLKPKYNSVRFTIPMDVRVLQNLKPHDYLVNYCIPQSYFLNICTRVFENNVKKEFTNLIQFLTKSYTEIFGYVTNESNVRRIMDLIGSSNEQIKENVKLFTASAAILMRIQCHEISSDEEKDKIEKMDFYLLRLNLKSFPIDLQTNKLLQFIDSI